MQIETDALIGREAELEILRRALDGVHDGATTLVLQGEAGIGKTVLWEAALADADARGYTVLRASGAQSEVQLLLGALSDLLEGLHETVLPALPPPQRRALAVALLLEDSDRRPEPRLLDVAFLTALRELAATGPVVVAVDDVQWLDATTMGLLSYAVRRLSSEPILVLLTRRAETPDLPTQLERAAAPRAFQRVELGPLTLGAVGALLRHRLNAGLPRPVLMRLHETSGGNAFFALELARARADARRQQGTSEGLPVPQSLRALVSERLANLPSATRDALLVAAAAGDPIQELVGAADLQPAVEAGIVKIADDRVRFTHPLLAASIVEEASPSRLREVHARLATLATDPEQRARHLAASATGPDDAIATALEEVAHGAFARGAPAAAADLLERALSLTDPADLPARARRGGEAGRFYAAIGDGVRGGALMRQAIDLLPGGHERATAIWLLLDSTTNIGDPVALGEDALRHAGDDDELRARIHSALSEVRLVRGELQAAYEHAQKARRLARDGDDELLRVITLARAANLETLCAGGDPEGDLRDAVVLEGALVHSQTHAVNSPRNHLGRRRFWQDDLDEARGLFEQLRQEAIVTYQDDCRPNVCLYLARIELRAGRCEPARAYAEEAFELAEPAGYTQVVGGALSVRALVDAWAGDLAAARGHLAESAIVAASVADRWHALHNRVTAGLLAASLGAWEDVLVAVGTMAEELDAIGVGEPGIFPFESDAIEALVATGQFDRAERLIERQASHDRPRTRAVAARGRGLVLEARGELAAALTELRAALRLHDEFTDPLERARAQLALGAALRHARQKREARETIEAALASFDELGATSFATRARAELERLSGRRTATGLTATEERVATLVAQGLSNKQAAAALVVSVKSIEAHLTRVYVKLDVRSRAELVHRFAARP